MKFFSEKLQKNKKDIYYQFVALVLREASGSKEVKMRRKSAASLFAFTDGNLLNSTIQYGSQQKTVASNIRHRQSVVECCSMF